MLPLIVAALLWWFTTGLIFTLSRRSQRTMRLAFILGTGLAVAACYGLWIAARNPEPAGAYLAFACGVVIWGWLVAGYYFGIVTGPASPRYAAGATLSTRARFRLALRGSIYHELMIVAVALLLLALSWGQPNRWGLWVFLALWLMHSTAKVAIFLGVRNFRVAFLPGHLHYVEELLGRHAGNRFLPFAACVAASISLALLYQAIAPGVETGATVGALLVATMLGLGIMEQLLLVVPLPVALYGWGVRSLGDDDPADRCGQRSLEPVSSALRTSGAGLKSCDTAHESSMFSPPSLVGGQMESYRS